MGNWGLALYNRFPAARRTLATAHGYLLRHHRYGGNASTLVDEAIERERWPKSRWKAFREEKLAVVLDRAAREVPYYRAYWTERRRRGDRAPWDVLGNWPVLEKDTLRKQPHAFLRDGHPGGLRTETTSGTTGQPVQLWFGREATRAWYALCEARFRRWNGVTRHDAWALLGAQLVAPAAQQKPPFWVWNGGLNQLYLSAYHVSLANAPYFLEAIRTHRIRYLWGHSSSLATLARAALDGGIGGLGLKVVISSAEPLTLRQREVIGHAFNCPARETYGMCEMVAAASECEHGRLHLWPEAGEIELADVSTNDAGHQAGDLLSTGFLNADMPLVRYRIGDRASFDTESSCPCGRTLPVVADIDGRISDMLITADGRRISPSAMEIVFDADLALKEAQIVQETVHSIRVRYVPAENFTPAMAATIAERVRSRMGDVAVTLESVVAIPRGLNSKFRAVVCLLPADETHNPGFDQTQALYGERVA